jgi:hypothetical protein
MRRQWVRSYQSPLDLAAYLQAAQVVADACGLPLADLTQQGRINCGARNKRRVMHMSVIYLTVVAKGVPAIRLSRTIGLNRAAITRICRKCEDRRDDPVLDQFYDRLTYQLTNPSAGVV